MQVRKTDHPTASWIEQLPITGLLLVTFVTVTLVPISFVPAEDQQQGKTKHVVLIVNLADKTRRKQFDDIAWRDGMTVLDAMNAARQRHDGIRFEYRGTGRTALLTMIDGMKNEGARGKNWLFYVNDKLADRSFAILQLKPADTIRWEFGKYP